MSSPQKFFSDLFLKPQYLIIKTIREFMAKVNFLDPFDHFVYQKVEDPLFSMWFSTIYKFKVFHDEVIPKESEGCCLFASNHQSIMDPMTSGLAIYHNSHRMPYQLTKSELGDDPLLGNYVSMNQVIYIKRGGNDTEALQRCVDVMVHDNRPVLVYPEGTYGPGRGQLLPFKIGIARLAWDAQVPVIPMATYGIDLVLPKADFKKFKPTNGLIQIRFGDPLSIATLFPMKKMGDILTNEDFQAAVNRIQHEVQALWNVMDKEYQLYN
jgi:1-acyl-sn-glycerol-3-phosphate acyltransferase